MIKENAPADPAAWRSNLFLADVSAHHLDLLADLVVRHEYAAGDAILVEGAPSDRVCLLTAGRAGVYKGA